MNKNSSLQEQLDELEFAETPTDIVQQAVAAFRAEHGDVNAPSDSFLALSRLGHQVIGHEIL